MYKYTGLQKPSRIHYECCYALLRTATNQYESTSSVANSTNRARFVVFVENFLTVKNILHERHEYPEPTRSVENHSQMRYVSLRVFRMCHECHS